MELLDSGLASWVVGHLFVHFTPEHWTLEHSAGSVGMELVRGHNTLVHFIHVHWPVCAHKTCCQQLDST